MMAKTGRTAKKRKPGRPPDPVQRVPLSLRVTPQVKGHLDALSSASGRSISQEAELRLEQSFRTEQQAWQPLEAAFGARQAGLMLIIGRLMYAAGAMAFDYKPGLHPFSKWMDQHNASENVRDAVSHFLTKMIPAAAGQPVRDEKDLTLDRGFTDNTIQLILEEVATGAAAEAADNPDFKRWARQVRELLGEDLAKRLLENCNKEVDDAR
jgi:hypothetical protein